MVPYKKLYTPEELDEVCQWIKDNKHRMPATLRLNDATVFTDFRATIDYYVDIIALHRENPTYGGQIHHVFQVQQKLKEMWGEEWSARCRTQTNEEKDRICSSPRFILLKSEMVGDASELIKQGL